MGAGLLRSLLLCHPLDSSILLLLPFSLFHSLVISTGAAPYHPLIIADLLKRQATHVGSVSGVVPLHGDQFHLLQLLQHGIQVVYISSVSIQQIICLLYMNTGIVWSRVTIYKSMWDYRTTDSTNCCHIYQSFSLRIDYVHGHLSSTPMAELHWNHPSPKV